MKFYLEHSVEFCNRETHTLAEGKNSTGSHYINQIINCALKIL